MWAAAAQPRTGLTPMIPTPSVDSGIGHLCVCSLAALEPQDLVDEDDGDALGDDLPIDDEDLVHGAVDAVRRLGAGILQRERVVVDPAQAFLEVRHDLLRPHHEDDSPGAAGVRSELTAAHRGRQQRSGLGDRVDAAEHHVRRRGQAADLVGLGVAVQAPDPWPNGGPCRSCVVRHGPEATLDGLIEVQLDFGGHRPLVSRGCFALYACTCKYLTFNLGAYANTS